MKFTTLRLAFAALIFATSCAGVGAGSGPTTRPDADADAPFALVELFTSEGCSSCPPADALLGDLIAESKAARVFALSFHVDYWNALGWPDRFASVAYTERQAAYAKAFRDDNVYTPQMVVNGRTAFVGSRATDARRAIADALRVPPSARLDIATAIDATARLATVDWTVAPTGKASADTLRGGVICVAVAQRQVQTDVRRGENAGRVLRHYFVVRAFAREPLAGRTRGGLTIRLPEDVKATDADIVAFVQNADTSVVFAATGTTLGRKRPATP